MTNRSALVLIACFGFSCASGAAQTRTINVADDASLREALAAIAPGTQIRIAPGSYRPGVFVRNARGTPQQPIEIGGSDSQNPPQFVGGSVAWQLSNCAHVQLHDMIVRKQTGNGINVDDGGNYETPSHHMVLEGIQVAEIGPRGNRDGIKLSGVDDFVIRNCTVRGWAGQAIDMVGCHRGRVEQCRFEGRDGFSQTTGPQTKGGSSEIVIRRCLFRDAGQRAVNVGGSTGLAYFRPPGAQYEAKNIVVEGCALVGSQAPIAFVGVDGAVVRYNTIVHPEKWVLRILQETTQPGFVACRNGRFEHNLIVFRRDDVSTFVNIGPHTQADTFSFENNLWYCEDRPDASRPDLPVQELGGVYGVDPQLAAPDDNAFRPGDPRAAAFGALAWKRE